jgi:hypothetical protein
MVENSTEDNNNPPEAPMDVRIIDDIAKRKWDLLRNILTALSVGFAAVSLFFTYCNTQSAIDNKYKTQEYVDTLNSGIANVAINLDRAVKSIESLPNAIEKFESTLTIFDGQLKTLNETASLFKMSLNELALVADTQLALMRETQKRWEYELSRKASLSLKYDRAQWLGDTLHVFFKLTSTGTKGAEYIWINISCPRQFSFYSKNWIPAGHSNGFEHWSYGPMEYIYGASALNDTVFQSNIYTRFKLLFNSEPEFPIKIFYAISYKEGASSGILEIPKIN